MASAEQVGNIVYEVEMNVARLIEAQQQVNKRLDQMDSKFEQSSRSAGRFEGALKLALPLQLLSPLMQRRSLSPSATRWLRYRRG